MPKAKLQELYVWFSRQQCHKQDQKMSSAIRVWSVAASVGAVEALKDQGICRWNHVLRSAQQHLKNNLASFSQANKLSSSSSAMLSTTSKHEKPKKSEESLRTYKMSSAQRAWIVAGSVGVVEALKDQAVCRWNHSFKSAQHVFKTHVGSFSQAKNLSSSSMVSTSNRLKGNQSEESLRTVMYLSSWGPN
ncbi:hypothetical protein CR513_23701, partial [Mucuna pruriens]